jgi:hypothetical protein
VIAVEWAEGFALPIAPLILLAQGASVTLPRWWMRVAVSLACFGTIYWMYVYVREIDLAPEEGANIGAGVLLLEVAVSQLLLAVTALREVAEAGTKLYRRRRERRQLP